MLHHQRLVLGADSRQCKCYIPTWSKHWALHLMLHGRLPPSGSGVLAEPPSLCRTAAPGVEGGGWGGWWWWWGGGVPHNFVVRRGKVDHALDNGGGLWGLMFLCQQPPGLIPDPSPTSTGTRPHERREMQEERHPKQG